MYYVDSRKDVAHCSEITNSIIAMSLSGGPLHLHLVIQVLKHQSVLHPICLHFVCAHSFSVAAPTIWNSHCSPSTMYQP